MKAKKVRRANTKSASTGLSLPLARGLVLVLSTSGSNFLSARSFMAQPALLIKKVPSRNIRMCFHEGAPLEAMKSDHIVGQSNKSVPCCLGRRTRSDIADSFPRAGAQALTSRPPQRQPEWG